VDSYLLHSIRLIIETASHKPVLFMHPPASCSIVISSLLLTSLRKSAMSKSNISYWTDLLRIRVKKISIQITLKLQRKWETTASGFLFTTFTFDTFDNRNSITQTGTVHASSGKLFNRHLKLTSYFFKKVINVKVKYIILNGFAKNSSKKNFNSDLFNKKQNHKILSLLTFVNGCNDGKVIADAIRKTRLVVIKYIFTWRWNKEQS